jgi:hypothetical protein
MAVQVLKSPRITVDGIDISCKADSLTLTLECDMQEKTSYCSSGFRNYTPGLINWTLDVSGFYSAGDNSNDDVDDNSLSKIGADTYSYFLVLPKNAASTGDLAYFGKSNVASYEALGDVGEVAPFSLSLQGDSRINRGTVVCDQTITGTSGYGEVYNLNGLEDGQFLQTILELANFSGAGNVIITLDASCTSGFGSGISEVAFTTLTESGADLQTSVLTSTDKHFYRIDYASSGPTSIDVTVALAENHGA